MSVMLVTVGQTLALSEVTLTQVIVDSVVISQVQAGPPGAGMEQESVVASQALAAGDLVNIWNNAGVANARKADAATNKEAHGYTLAAVLLGGTATVWFVGTNEAQSGMTPGPAFLSVTVPGKVQAAAPTGSGELVQRVGLAVSATKLVFEPITPIQLA